MQYLDLVSIQNSPSFGDDCDLADAGLTRLGGAIMPRHEDGTPRLVVEELTWLGRLVEGLRSGTYWAVALSPWHRAITRR